MPFLISRVSSVLAAALVAVAAALPALAVSYPAPKRYVNDFAGVMEAGAAENLNNVLSDLDSRGPAQTRPAARHANIGLIKAGGGTTLAGQLDG